MYMFTRYINARHTLLCICYVVFIYVYICVGLSLASGHLARSVMDSRHFYSIAGTVYIYIYTYIHLCIYYTIVYYIQYMLPVIHTHICVFPQFSTRFLHYSTGVHFYTSLSTSRRSLFCKLCYMLHMLYLYLFF